MANKTKVQPSGSNVKRSKRDSFMVMTRRSSLGSIETKFSHDCCRSTILLANTITLLVGLIFSSLGGIVILNTPKNPTFASIVLVVLGLLLSIICIVALIASKRLKREMKEQSQMEIWTQRKQEATCSQNTLKTYFFLTLFLIPVLVLAGIWVLSSLEFAVDTFTENCNNFDSAGVAKPVVAAVKDFCGTLDKTQFTQILQGAAALCFCASALQCVAAFGAIRIVTLFAIMQSLLQMINLFFIILGYLIVFFGNWALNMNALQGGDGFGNEVYYVVIAVGGVLCVMALVGYMAAHRESKILLWLYALICLIALTCSAATAFVLNANGGGEHHVHKFVQNNCDELVVAMDETWFKSALGCRKYVGEAEYAQKIEGNVSWKVRQGPGIVTSCKDISTNKFAWEYNLGLTLGSKEQLNYDEDGKAVAYFGCINRGCCKLIEGAYEVHKSYLGITLFVVAVLVAFAFLSALFMARTKSRLRKEGFEDNSPMLLHTQDCKILVLIVIFFIAGLIGSVWFATGGRMVQNTLQVNEIGEISDIKASVKIRKDSTVRCNSFFGKATTNINNTCSNCHDGVQSGDETCVDGGGSCASRCNRGESCSKSNDCESSLLCNPKTLKCTKPVEMSVILCSNNVHDIIPGHVESGKDCGQVCGTSKLCALSSKCSSDSDCANSNCLFGICTNILPKGGVNEVCQKNTDCEKGLFCFQNKCSGCSDGIRNGDETSVDCGASMRHPITGRVSSMSLGCPGCPEGKSCLADADCKSNQCDKVSNTCSSCFNQKTDGSETDIDCGGSKCHRCSLNQKCAKGSDCKTDLCVGEKCVKPVSNDCGSDSTAWALTCYAPTCQDGLLTTGAGETCVDGGGATCRILGKTCATGEKCLIGLDCTSGKCYHDPASKLSFGTCVSCTDGILSPGETSIDCGGTKCSKCNDGDSCVVNSDCRSNSCDATSKTCISCFDGQLNGGETSVDCGGNCPRCIDGEKCLKNNDCKIGSLCVQNLCSSCTNRLKDGNESDIDCGNACNKPCPLNKSCATHTDCVTKWCDKSTKKCVAMPSTSTISNPQIDLCRDECGGSKCPRCKDGKSCAVNSDCRSNSCDAKSKICVSCFDKKLNGDETSVDCGGNCPRCANKKSCRKNSDCLSQNCFIVPEILIKAQDTLSLFQSLTIGASLVETVGTRTGFNQMFDESPPAIAADIEQNRLSAKSGICVSCGNSLLDGEESDIDCGGSRCKKCAIEKKCVSNSDCLSSLCDSLKGICIKPPTLEELCTNGKKDEGKESDVDCGNMCNQFGNKCMDKQRCQKDDDCQSQQCDDFGFCISCTDGLKNGHETCIDGGGICSNGCTLGSQCKRNSDCNSGRCEKFAGTSTSTSNTGFFCAGCNDNKKTGLEWFVDVGGPCGLGKSGADCNTNSQCESNHCMNSKCQDCFNNIKDNGEEDVDCGGFCSKKCAKAMNCNKHESCVTGYCSTQSSTCIDMPPKEHCSNGQTDLDKGETCQDGGGPGCTSLGLLCDDGAACADGSDCKSGNCFNKICHSCIDNVKNGDETSIDCGGNSCGPCADSKACVKSSDCVSGDCFNNICRSCIDNVKNGDETSIDCGGNSCGPCADSKACVKSSDCLSGLCSASGKCSSCDNAVLDGVETDVDCGGLDSCKPCALGKMCSKSSDCLTEFCDSNSNTCKQPTPEVYCSNNVLDADKGETSVDCGGLGCRSVQKLCNSDQTCKIDTDCSSGICNDSKCIDCTNKCATHNSRCPKCIDGSACSKSSECGALSVCESSVCVSHHDRLTNFNETDSDCGGPLTNQGLPGARRCGVNETCQKVQDCDLNLKCWANKCRMSIPIRLETTVKEKIVFSSSKLKSGCAAITNAFRLTAQSASSLVDTCVFRAAVTVTNRGSVRVGQFPTGTTNLPVFISEKIFKGNLGAINNGLASLIMCPFCGHASHKLSAKVVVVSGPCTLGSQKRRGATVGIIVDIQSDEEQLFLGKMVVHGTKKQETSAVNSVNILARSSNCAMSLTRVNHDANIDSGKNPSANFQVSIPHSSFGPKCATVELAGTNINSLLVHVPHIAGTTNLGILHIDYTDSATTVDEKYRIFGNIFTGNSNKGLPQMKLELFKSVANNASCLQSVTAFKSYTINQDSGAFETDPLFNGMYTLVVRNVEGYHPMTKIIYLNKEMNENIYLVPNEKGIHIQAEWDNQRGPKTMHLYVGFKATTKNSKDIFCRVFSSRASCGKTFHVGSHESMELINIKETHASIYTIFARNYDESQPSELSKLKVSIYDQTTKLSEYGLPSQDRTNYADYIFNGDEKFETGVVKAEIPYIENGTEFKYQKEARFIRIACITKDGQIHSAPQYSYHQTSLLSECPPKNIKYCSGIRKLKLNISSGLSISDGSEPGHHYLNEMNCRFDVTAPSGYFVEVTFPTFNLENANEVDLLCSNDYLEINGKKYCGTNGPSNLLLEPPFSIHFKSDKSKTNFGFSGRLKLVDKAEKNIKDCGMHKTCGGCLSETVTDCAWCASSHTCLASFKKDTCFGNSLAIGEPNQCHCSKRLNPVPLPTNEGTFEDGSSLEDTYQPESNCKWTVDIPYNKWIKVSFESFDLEAGISQETSNICPYDRLTIGEKSVCGNTKNLTICQQSKSTTTIAIPTKITFTSDAATQGLGFVANYKIGSAADIGCNSESINTVNKCTCKNGTPAECNAPNDLHRRSWCEVDYTENPSDECKPAFMDYKFDQSTFEPNGALYVDYCYGGQNSLEDLEMEEPTFDGYGASGEESSMYYQMDNMGNDEEDMMFDSWQGGFF